MSLIQTLNRLVEYDTALLANTIGFIDPTPPEEFYMSGAIQSVTPSLGPSVGVAVTCKLDSSTPGKQADLSGFWELVDRIDKMEEPAVWVCEAVGSRPEHECVFGDGMAKALYVAGCSALVTNGGVRDIPGLMSIPFAAYARGLTIHHCALTVSGVNEPVQVGGIRVNPGDVIHANNEGVIKIPAGCLQVLPEKAGQMLVFEKEAHEIMRRPDLPPLEKPKETARLLKKFGF